MTGEKPGESSTAIIASLIGCCGFIFFFGADYPSAHADEIAAKHADMIPQNEVVVQNGGAMEELPITYSLRIYKGPDRIKLKGNMSSEEDYKTLIGMVKANFPSINLTDRIKVKDELPDSEVKIGGLSFALRLLGYIENGQASVDNNGLSLEGAATTAVVLTEVQNLIDNNKPTGVPIKNIRITPPETAWNASLTPDGTIKLSGVLPSKNSQETIFNYAKTLFLNSSIEDESEINNKLPSRWAQAAKKSMDLLFLLNKGSVEITEQTIYLKGVAPSEHALKSLDVIAKDLPSSFNLKSEVTAPAYSQADIAIMPRVDDAVAK